MAKIPSRKELNQRWWRIVSFCAAVGFTIVIAIYLMGLNSTGLYLEEKFFQFLALLCPPLIVTMAINNQSRSEVLQIYGMIGIVNGMVYTVLGMFIATVREQIERRRTLK